MYKDLFENYVSFSKQPNQDDVYENHDDFDEKTLVGSALNMLAAGYDTTSYLLSLTCYYLALHPGENISFYELLF